MRRFRKVSQPVEHAVILTIKVDANRVIGLIVAPSFSDTNPSFIITPQDGLLTAEQAVGAAIGIASYLKLEVVVIDEEGHWDSKWGGSCPVQCSSEDGGTTKGTAETLNCTGRSDRLGSRSDLHATMAARQ